MPEAILIVDETASNRKLTQRVLSSAGYDVRSVPDAAAALDAIPEFQPKLVLTELRLGGMDGIALTRRIKGDPQTRQTLVIAVTGCGTEEDRRAALDAGCDDFIVKPIDTRAFAGLVETHLARRAPDANGVETAAGPPSDLPPWALELSREFVQDGLAKCGQLLAEASTPAEIQPAAHGWAGLGGTFGFPEITRLARELDKLCRSNAARAEVNRLLQCLQACFAQAAPGGATQPSSPSVATRPSAATQLSLPSAATKTQTPGVATQPPPPSAATRPNAVTQAATPGAATQLSLPSAPTRPYASTQRAAPGAANQPSSAYAATQAAAPSTETQPPPPPLPAGLAQAFIGKTFALVGFDAGDSVRLDRALRAVGGQTLSGPAAAASTANDLTIAAAASPDTAAFLRDLRGAPSRPLLLVGAPGSVPQVETMLDSAAFDFAATPWTAEELLARAYRLLARRNQLAASPPPQPPARDRKLRIVIADDDPTVLALLKTTLESYGMDCAAACAGDQALETMRAAPPDAAILDVIMPNMDGLEVLAAIRNDPTLKNVRVLLLSALQQESDIVRALGLGADDYVTKPFSPVEVVARLKRLVRSDS
jgi:DNA-binding response OmpR family regulator